MTCCYFWKRKKFQFQSSNKMELKDKKHLYLAAGILIAGFFLVIFTGGSKLYEASFSIRENATAAAWRLIGETIQTEIPADNSKRSILFLTECFMPAVIGTDYNIPFTDSNIAEIKKKYTKEISSPEKGDLLFISTGTSEKVCIVDTVKTDRIIYISFDNNTGLIEYTEINRNDLNITGYARLKLSRR